MFWSSKFNVYVMARKNKENMFEGSGEKKDKK